MSPGAKQRNAVRLGLTAATAAAVAALATCHLSPGNQPHHGQATAHPGVGAPLQRRGDEIMIAGRLFHTATPVVLWTDEGGYDAYRVDRRFAPPEKAAWEHISGAIASPNRYGQRSGPRAPLPPNPSLPDVQAVIDQIVIHYDASGTSRQCFKILHDLRGLSAHFLIDVDGTVYQTLDVKDKAWHATKANNRSVGIEIAHIGAYPASSESPLDTWYTTDDAGARIDLPDWMGDGGVRTPGFIARPAREGLFRGTIHGRELVQPDYTAEQYQALAKLTAALCTALPRVRCSYPQAETGLPLDRSMTDEEFAAFSGLLGHSHVQDNKNDPGPAFDWERVTRDARAILEHNRD